MSSPVASRAHLPLRAGVWRSARVPQWKLNLEEPYGANNLDSQVYRREKGRSRWHGIHLRTPISGVYAEWQTHEGKGLEPVRERQRQRWRHLPSAVLRFVRKELQPWQREDGQRARPGITELRP